MRQGFASGLLALFILAGAAMMLSACNTVAGAGQDLRDAGQAITNSAQKTQQGQ
jgi:entericidin B